MIKHELSDAVRDIAKRYRPENAIGLSPCDCDDLNAAADALDALQIKANKYDLLMDALLTMTGGAVTHGDKPDPQIDTLLDKVKECRELRAEVERRDAAARKALANMTGFGTEEDPVTVLAVFGQTTADKNRELLAENAKLRGEVEKLKDIIDARIGREINATEDMHDYSVRKREATVIRESFATWQKSRSQTPNGGEVGNG